MAQYKKPSEILEGQMRKEFQALTKGKKLPDGTIREWGGKKYQKKGGKWVPYTESGFLPYDPGEKKKKSGLEERADLIDAILSAARKAGRTDAKKMRKDLASKGSAELRKMAKKAAQQLAGK